MASPTREQLSLPMPLSMETFMNEVTSTTMHLGAFAGSRQRVFFARPHQRVFSTRFLNQPAYQNSEAEKNPLPQHLLQNLEKLRVEVKEEEESICSVCLEKLSTESKAICLPKPCSHVFHEHCITTWLERSNTCPMCRRAIHENID